MKNVKLNLSSLSKDYNLSDVTVITPLNDDRKDKKEKRPKRPDHITGPVPYEVMLKDADCYENYLSIIETYCILKGVSEEAYNKARKKIRKMIKLLREGKGDKVYDVERYHEYMESENQRDEW